MCVREDTWVFIKYGRHGYHKFSLEFMTAVPRVRLKRNRTGGAKRPAIGEIEGLILVGLKTGPGL
jgi:hypothetical protein